MERFSPKFKFDEICCGHRVNRVSKFNICIPRIGLRGLNGLSNLLKAVKTDSSAFSMNYHQYITLGQSGENRYLALLV